MRGDQPVVSAASWIVSPSFTRAEPYHSRVKVEVPLCHWRYRYGVVERGGVMRSLGAVLAVVALLAIPGVALANPVGTATTTTGQRLTVTIDSPADGALEPGPYVQMSGHATLSPASEGEAGTSITRVADGMGDGYGAPGSSFAQDAVFDPATGAWNESNRWG